MKVIPCYTEDYWEHIYRATSQKKQKKTGEGFDELLQEEMEKLNERESIGKRSQ